MYYFALWSDIANINHIIMHPFGTLIVSISVGILVTLCICLLVVCLLLDLSKR